MFIKEIRSTVKSEYHFTYQVKTGFIIEGLKKSGALLGSFKVLETNKF